MSLMPNLLKWYLKSSRKPLGKRRKGNHDCLVSDISFCTSKYKFMEVNLLQRRKVLEDKIPEIEKTLAMVGFLVDKQDSSEPVYTDFELNDTLYAQAKIEPSGTVYLWLGVSPPLCSCFILLILFFVGKCHVGV